MTYEELTDALAAKLGIEGLVRKDGVCSVDIDGMVVSFVHIKASNTVADEVPLSAFGSGEKRQIPPFASRLAADLPAMRTLRRRGVLVPEGHLGV